MTDTTPDGAASAGTTAPTAPAPPTPRPGSTPGGRGPRPGTAPGMRPDPALRPGAAISDADTTPAPVPDAEAAGATQSAEVAASPAGAAEAPWVPATAASGAPLEADMVPVGPLAAGMGIRFLEVGADRAVATMPVEGNTQPLGLLHGGASAVLAETLGSVAAALYAAPERTAVGIELSVSHHRSARSGLVTGTARAVHQGSNLVSYEIVVVDEGERRLATARLTCFLRPMASAG